MLTHLDNMRPINMADPVNRQHPLNQGRVSWWLGLPELSGGRCIYDLMQSVPGVLTNMTTAATGWAASTRPGGYASLKLDGATVGAYVDTKVTGIVGPPLTFTAWVYRTTGTGQRAILGNSSSNGIFMLAANGSFPLTYVWENTPDEYFATTGLDVPFNAWSFAAVSITATAATVYLVPSGGVLQSWTNTKAHTTHTIGPMYIGSDRLHNDWYWPGGIDDVSIYNRALSSTEIFELYNISKAGYPGLLNRIPQRMLDNQGLGGTAWVKALMETLAYSDARMASPGKSFAETITLSDTRLAAPGKSLTESLTYTDARASAVGKLIAESLAFADNRSARVIKSLAEVLSLVDAFSGIKNAGGTAWFQTLTETLSYTDVRSVSVVRSLVEALTYTDARTVATRKAIAETLSLSDARAARVAKPLAELLSLADAFLSLKNTGGTAWFQSLTETLSYTDARTVSVVRNIVESLMYTDARAAAVTHPLAEALTYTDARSAGISRPLTESIPFTDARTASIGKAFAETLSLSDSRSASVVKSLAEAYVLTDARAAGLVRQLAETYNITDILAARLVTLGFVIVTIGGSTPDSVTITNGGLAQ